MAEFSKVMREKDRMTRGCRIHCSDCLLSSSNNSNHATCEYYIRDYPEEVEKIIMDWAQEHPRKTNGDVLKEILIDKFGLEADALANVQKMLDKEGSKDNDK